MFSSGQLGKLSGPTLINGGVKQERIFGELPQRFSQIQNNNNVIGLNVGIRLI